MTLIDEHLRFKRFGDCNAARNTLRRGITSPDPRLILYRGAVWGGIAAGVLLLAQGRF